MLLFDTFQHDDSMSKKYERLGIRAIKRFIMEEIQTRRANLLRSQQKRFHLRRMNLFNPIWERKVVFLRNDILVKLATHFGPNHKMKVETQSRFCFPGEKPNQSEADCSDSHFANVESKSSPR